MNIVVLPSNCPPDRFYAGGPRIRQFRGEPRGTDRQPEDWIASTTTLAGESELGLTVLPDGGRLLDAIAEDPVAWLGQAHLDRFGVDTRLLVKLLDAGERLPVHAHPDTLFAQQHVGRAHGKAEAWFMLAGGPVHVGLRETVSAESLARMVNEQRTDEVLALLHEVDVAAGDVVYVPPGTLHAIGAGVFLVEVQEPEDLSVLLEWEGFALDGRKDGHLGLGFDLALQAVDRRAVEPEKLNELIRPAGFGESVLPIRADEYFRMERREVTEPTELDAGFAVIVVTGGSGHIRGAESIEVERGTTLVAPNAAGPIEVDGRIELVVCRPPR